MMMERLQFRDRVAHHPKRLLARRLELEFGAGLHLVRLLDGGLVLLATEPWNVHRYPRHQFAHRLAGVVVAARLNSQARLWDPFPFRSLQPCPGRFDFSRSAHNLGPML